MIVSIPITIPILTIIIIIIIIITSSSTVEGTQRSALTFSWRPLSGSQAARTAFPSRSRFLHRQDKNNQRRVRLRVRAGQQEAVDVHQSSLLSSHAGGCFNHDLVGITNPTLAMSSSSFRDCDNECDPSLSNVNLQEDSNTGSPRTSTLQRQLQAMADTLLVNHFKHSHVDGDENSNAIIGTTISKNISNKAKGIDTKSGWRIYRHQKIVGRGEECYRNVRDAVLGWEAMHQGSDWAGVRLLNYHSRGYSSGTLRQSDGAVANYEHNIVGQVKLLQRHISPFLQHTGSSNHQHRHRTTYMEQIECDEIASTEKVIYEERDPLRSALLSDRVLQITNSPGVKRLVTFAQVSLMQGKMRLPIWIANPCMVVYDLVDERCGKTQSTYSATAYATLRGHLLSGEERVSVAMNDHSKDVSVEILSYSHATPGLLGRVVFASCRGMQARFFGEEIDTLEKIAQEANNSKKNAAFGGIANCSVNISSYNGNLECNTEMHVLDESDMDDDTRQNQNRILMSFNLNKNSYVAR